MRRFFLLIFLWSQLLAAQVENHRLSGNVTYNGNPVAGARVEVAETGQAQTTGKQGAFRFQLPAGTYHLSVSYKDIKLNRKITLHRDVHLTLELHPATEQLQAITVNLSRAGDQTPVSKDNLTREQIRKRLDVHDVPYVLEDLPSVVSFSDAGNGVGYTGIRIRGISPQQINVSLNGIPLNDPESQSVYWVDIPDFLTSVRSVQVQRGIGTSNFGTGAFGANIDLQTETFSAKPYFRFSSVLGSFNTAKVSLAGSTGLLGKHFSVVARWSGIRSDGYVDRAFSRMRSHYLAATYRAGHHRLSLIHFGGHERTYQAWYGVDWETFRTNPTFNYAGAIYDDQWNVVDYYKDQVDDYTQNHYQLHYSFRPSAGVQYRLTAHYTKGYGYYEQYKQDQSFDKYGLAPLVFGTDTIRHTDLIRRKWLDNDFYGIIAGMQRQTGAMQWTLGLGANRYTGDHFGKIIWARYASGSEKGHTYYFNTGIKTEWNGFVKTEYRLSDRINLYTDIQIRKLDYSARFDPARTFDDDERFSINDRLLFVNPKIGLFYRAGEHWSFYTSLARAHREPNRTDYKENSIKPKPETLNDWETGVHFAGERFHWKSTFYLMYYRNQLVYSGRLNPTGYPIRENVGRSYRAGIENSLAYRRGPWDLSAAFTLSDNRNLDYKAWDGNQYKSYGNTQISYSPAVTGSLRIGYALAHQIRAELTGKYVGKQYLDNRNIPESVLPAYHVENFVLTYENKIRKKSVKYLLKFKIINIFAVKYAANGYMWGNTAYVFPQAGRQFFLTLDVRI